MSRPIVIAHHLIFTVYGWWLPNDPRGSMSRQVRNLELRDLGELHFERKEVQPSSNELRAFYRDAAKRLKHSLLEFDVREIEIVAKSFADVIKSKRYTCYACAVMPDHVHLLIRKHKHTAEEMIERFQETSRAAVLSNNGRHEPGHPVWGGPGWSVFLEHPDDVHRTMRYIEQNPVKVNRPVQQWSFI